MARPNVKFKINDESLVISPTEEFSQTIAGVYNPTNIIRTLGNTAEKNVGYFYVPDLSSWFTRLNDLVIRNAKGITFIEGTTAYSLGSCASSYLNGLYNGGGISSGFSGEWWPIHNYLQYGGGCYVGFGDSEGASGFYNLPLDIVFQGGTAGPNGNIYATAVTNIVDYREQTDNPCIGVINVSSANTPNSSITATSGTNNRNYIRVYGEKIHFDLQGLYTVKTPLAADVAGCIARTDRDYYPWFSPAGTRRGRILNVIQVSKTLTALEQDDIYKLGINPVVTFPGEGTLLFGDKTGETSSSTLSRINVSRLFIYIRKALAPVARSILFEQNDSSTRARFRVAAEGFLERIVGQRGISEYKVICDTTNNTPEIIEGNYFVADILIKPITSINYITITLTNKDLSSTF